MAFSSDYDLQFQCRVTTAWNLATRTKPAPAIASFDLFVFACDSKATSFVFDAKHSGDFAKDGLRLKTPLTCETDLWSITGVRRTLLPIAFWTDVFKCFMPAPPSSFPIVMDLSAHVGTALAAAIQREVGYVGVIQDPDAFTQFSKTAERLILATCEDQQISIWSQNFDKFIKVSQKVKMTLGARSPASSQKETIVESEPSEGEDQEEDIGVQEEDDT